MLENSSRFISKLNLTHQFFNAVKGTDKTSYITTQNLSKFLKNYPFYKFSYFDEKNGTILYNHVLNWNGVCNLSFIWVLSLKALLR